MEIYLLYSIFFLLGSALFSCAETSITGSSKALLFHEEQNGSTRAKIVNKLIKNYDMTIACLLVGNNLCNIFLTVYLSLTFSLIFPNINIVITTLIITAVILMFAELFPKTYAFSNSNRLAIFLAPLLYVLVIIIYPFAYIFLKINNLFLKYIIKAKDIKPLNIASLRGAIEIYDSNTNDDTTQQTAMLHGILDLNELQLLDSMTHRKNVFALDINLPSEIFLSKILNSIYNKIPIYEENIDKIIGIINLQDIMKTCLKNNKNLKDLDFHSLIKAPYFAPETTLVSDLFKNLQNNKERMALIIDEYGSFMGLITIEDILEEITGEINNISQGKETEIKKIKNSYIFSGTLKIRDLNRKLNLKIPDEDFTTIAGMILYETEQIPKVGSVFVFYGYKFEILEKKKHQLSKIRMSHLN